MVFYNCPYSTNWQRRMLSSFLFKLTPHLNRCCHVRHLIYSASHPKCSTSWRCASSPNPPGLRWASSRPGPLPPALDFRFLYVGPSYQLPPSHHSLVRCVNSLMMDVPVVDGAHALGRLLRLAHSDFRRHTGGIIFWYTYHLYMSLNRPEPVRKHFISLYIEIQNHPNRDVRPEPLCRSPHGRR